MAARTNDDGVLGALADLTVYDNPPLPKLLSVEDTAPICRQGKTGTK